MPTIHRVRGTVPPDSPLRALAGRTVTMPAETLEDLVERVREMRRAQIEPVILPARYVPWTPIAVTLTIAVLAALTTAIIAIISGHDTTAWTAAGAMVLCMLGLFPVLAHQELEAKR